MFGSIPKSDTTKLSLSYSMKKRLSVICNLVDKNILKDVIIIIQYKLDE